MNKSNHTQRLNQEPIVEHADYISLDVHMDGIAVAVAERSRMQPESGGDISPS